MAKKKNKKAKDSSTKEKEEKGSVDDQLAKDLKKKTNLVSYSDSGKNKPKVADWISTGNTMLDLSISNQKDGGLPVGRITEIHGWESSGKSLLVYHVLGNTQKKGGKAILFDTESAADEEFMQSAGVDTDQLLLDEKTDTIEDIFAEIKSVISTIRENDRDVPVTIAVDSLAGTSTKPEKEADTDKKGYNTTKAVVMSQQLPLINRLISDEKILIIFTNQLRVDPNVQFGDPSRTPGGKSLPFHADVRLQLKYKGKIKSKNRLGFEETIGIQTRATPIKNKVGPPYRTVEYDAYFQSGIDDKESWIKMMTDLDIAKKSGGGGWLTYEDDDGNEHKFRKNNMDEVIFEDKELKDEIYRKITEKYIMEYEKPNKKIIKEDNDDD